ncbi:MAG: NAD(P)/FAD-dependent oxidoreductase [Candidatus Micrarchaeota archaeon]|nr:NAD(P)/FAD-dependent oxidoreductase [Candidatus Micrarchaeota archaeon]
MFDVHVVGGGPAGSFAGISALRAGRKVLLSEEHPHVGQPVHCSGLVSASGLEQMKDVVPFHSIILNPIRRANLHGQHARVSLTYKTPKAYVIDRGQFDLLAAGKFVDMGGMLKAGHAVRSLADLQSTNVIGADGPISTVARLFNFPPLRHFASSYQGDFKYSAPDLSAVEVFFNPEWAPGFIGWIIPTSDCTAKIGLGVSRPGYLPLAKKVFLGKLELARQKPVSEFSALIPIDVREKTAGVFKFGGSPARPSEGGAHPPASRTYNVCLAGDSAGQVKSTSGGGIFFGASCGRLAGRYAADPARYESAWRGQYGFDLRLHRLARQGLDALNPAGLDVWLRTLKMLRFDWLLSEAGEMDEFSKMLSLKTLGAYAHGWLPEPLRKAKAPAMPAPSHRKQVSIL